MNSFSDLLTTILPIPIVMRLQMPLRQRIGVCVLLCLGFVVTVAGALRTYFIWRSLIDSWDQTWYAYPLWIAAAIEIDLAVVSSRDHSGGRRLIMLQICACAPAWKSLLQQPIVNISTRVSSKLSSFRSPSHSEATPGSTPLSSSNGKSSIFNPLRSLPRWQITKLEFEKDDTPSSRQSAQDIEKGVRDPVEKAVEGPETGSQQDIGGKDFRHAEVVLEDSLSQTSRSVTPTLQIMKSQCVEQEVMHISEFLNSSPRPSPSDLGPGQWLSERRGGKRLSPYR